MINVPNLILFSPVYTHYSAFSTIPHNTACLQLKEGGETEPSDNLNIFGGWFVVFLGIFIILLVLNAVINVMNSGLDAKINDAQYTIATNERTYQYWKLDTWCNKAMPFNLFFALIDLMKWIIKNILVACGKEVYKCSFLSKGNQFVPVTTGLNYKRPIKVSTIHNTIALEYLRKHKLQIILTFKNQRKLFEYTVKNIMFCIC